jgi:hypothetical protein
MQCPGPKLGCSKIDGFDQNSCERSFRARFVLTRRENVRPVATRYLSKDETSQPASSVASHACQPSSRNAE